MEGSFSSKGGLVLLRAAEKRAERMEEELGAAREALELCRLDAEAAMLEREEAVEALEVAEERAAAALVTGDEEVESLRRALGDLAAASAREAAVWTARHAAAEACGAAAVAYGVAWREAREPELEELLERRRDEAAEVVEHLAEKNAVLEETEAMLRARLDDLEVESQVLRDLDDAQASEIAALGSEIGAARHRADVAEAKALRLAAAAESLAADGDALRDAARRALADRDAEAARSRDDVRARPARAFVPSPPRSGEVREFLAARARRIEAPAADLAALVDAPVADAAACADVARAVSALELCESREALRASVARARDALGRYADRCGGRPPARLASELLAARAASEVVAASLGDRHVAAMGLRRALAALDAAAEPRLPPDGDDDGEDLLLFEPTAALWRPVWAGGVVDAANALALADEIRAALIAPGGRDAEALATIAVACHRGDRRVLEMPARCRLDDAALATARSDRRDARDAATAARNVALDRSEAASAAGDARSRELDRLLQASLRRAATLDARRADLDAQLAASTRRATALAEARDSDATALRRLESETENLRRALDAKLDPPQKGPATPT
ncbi:hypothetical protein CTAYLR_007818, partial [Chrysophaeum taylorii]